MNLGVFKLFYMYDIINKCILVSTVFITVITSGDRKINATYPLSLYITGNLSQLYCPGLSNGPGCGTEDVIGRWTSKNILEDGQGGRACSI